MIVMMILTTSNLMHHRYSIYSATIFLSNNSNQEKVFPYNLWISAEDIIHFGNTAPNVIKNEKDGCCDSNFSDTNITISLASDYSSILYCYNTWAKLIMSKLTIKERKSST